MLRFIISLGLITFPMLGIAQVTKDAITNGLPKGLKYKFITDNFYKLTADGKSKLGQKQQIGDSVHIGCSRFEKEGLPIAFAFAIREKECFKNREMLLYAIKRENYRLDEEILNALDYYCYYGQSNYYFMSKKYLLFTNALSGDFFARKDPIRMAKIENQLVKNLNGIK